MVSYFKDIKRGFLTHLIPFLSIVVILALGVGFYVGIQSTGYNMQQNIESYLSIMQGANIRLQTSFGISKSLIQEVEQLDGVNSYHCVKEVDGIAINNQSSLLRIIESNIDFFGAKLVDGRFPSNSQEIVLDAEYASKYNVLLEETVHIEAEELSETTFKVVGLIRSPLYITKNRGNSSLTNGSIQGLVFVYPNTIQLDRYTSLFIQTNVETHELVMSSLKKNTILYQVIQRQDVTVDANKTLKEKEVELQQELIKAKDELTQASEQMIQGEKELVEKQKILLSGLQEIESQLKIDNASKTIQQRMKDIDKRANDIIDEANQQIPSAEKQLQDASKTIQQAKKEIVFQQERLVLQKKELLEQAQQVETNLTSIINQKESLQESLDVVNQSIENVVVKQEEIIKQQQSLTDKINQLTSSLNQQLTTIHVTGNLQYTLEDIAWLKQHVLYLNSIVYQETVASLEESLLAEDDCGAQQKQLEISLVELNTKKEELLSALTFLHQKQEEIQQQLGLSGNDNQQLLLDVKSYFAEKNNLIEQGLKQITEQETNLKLQEESVKNKYLELETQINKLNQLKENIFTLKEGVEKFVSGRVEIANSKQLLQDQEQQFLQESKQALSKLAEAKQKLQEVDFPQIYIEKTSEYHVGLQSFLDDSHSIENIGQFFPLFFFFVATVVSLVSTKRMIQEDKLNIATYYSLGYSKTTIVLKYLIYSFIVFAASLVIGLFLGYFMIPKMIIEAYRAMYDIPSITIHIALNYLFIPVLLCFLATFAVSLYSLATILKQSNAQMLRRDVLINGKRILLEKFGFFWRNLSFLQKISLRNLFRNKLRLLMSVIGIAGCTALLLTGFALKDSITTIADKQYKEIIKYKHLLFIDEDFNQQEVQKQFAKYSYLLAETKTVQVSNYNVLLHIVENDNQEFIQKNIVSKLELDGVYISSKLAELMHLHVGDSITIIQKQNNLKQTLRIQSIIENYIGHIMIVDRDYWQQLGNQFEVNSLLVKEQLAPEVLESAVVSYTVNNQELYQQIQSSMKAFYTVMWIIVLSAALLAFVVLFNLSTMNLQERTRELATLKVLGFRKKETALYLFIEDLILLVLGCLLGLFLGKMLHYLVVYTAEVENLVFIKKIQLSSVLFALALTILFNSINQWITLKRIARIDMLQALKSVE